MIYINNNNKFNRLTSNNYYVVSDFDQTITTYFSNTTFSLFANSGLYPNEYLKEKTKLFNYYRPLELNHNLSYNEKLLLSEKWHMESHQLMIKYKIKESDIDYILNQKDALILREGVIDFIDYLNKNKIPLIICSAGIGNFIVEILRKNNCLTPNIFIHSNFLKFNNNIIDLSPINVHSMVKNKITLPNEFLNKINNKDYAVVIGDQLNDLQMANYLPKQDTISFGFLESNIEENKKIFMNSFDTILTDQESFKSIQKILEKKQSSS